MGEGGPPPFRRRRRRGRGPGGTRGPGGPPREGGGGYEQRGYEPRGYDQRRGGPRPAVERSVGERALVEREQRERRDYDERATARPAGPPQEEHGFILALPDGRTVFRAAERPSDALRANPRGDAAVPPGFLLTKGLRPGDEATVLVDYSRGRPAVVDAVQVAGVSPEEAAKRPRFDSLTAVHPERHIKLERPGSTTARILDLFAPIGFGSRVLVVSPPKAGKTTILREIALSVIENHPEVHLICCLIGERPEEATEFTRLLPKETSAGTPVEVVFTTFDDATSRHAAMAELTAERARRLVESKKDVVLLVDSITRMVRAFNLAVRGPAAGRTLSGGVAAGALAPSRRFFGAARAIEEGGSLTVIASCLVMTGSRQDDLVYEELKGTGNSEIQLDRKLAERRIFPAINLPATGTRREELILDPKRLDAVQKVRRVFATAENFYKATERLVERIEATKNNDAFIASLPGMR